MTILPCTSTILGTRVDVQFSGKQGAASSSRHVSTAGKTSAGRSYISLNGSDHNVQAGVGQCTKCVAPKCDKAKMRPNGGVLGQVFTINVNVNWTIMVEFMLKTNCWSTIA